MGWLVSIVLMFIYINKLESVFLIASGLFAIAGAISSHNSANTANKSESDSKTECDTTNVE